jgi:2-methylcitrate synthase
VANTCEFEEIAYLLVHGKLPTTAELKGYKAKLKSLRGLPQAVKAALEALPASAHPMDVMRTGVSVLGCVLPEKDDHNTPGARHRRPPDGVVRFHAAVLVPLQPQRQTHRSGNR